PPARPRGPPGGARGAARPRAGPARGGGPGATPRTPPPGPGPPGCPASGSTRKCSGSRTRGRRPIAKPGRRVPKVQWRSSRSRRRTGASTSCAWTCWAPTGCSTRATRWCAPPRRASREAEARARCSSGRGRTRSKPARRRSCATSWVSGCSDCRASPASTRTSHGARCRGADEDHELKESEMSEPPAVLHYDEKEIELPTVRGSENEAAVDISKLRSQTGFITLDYGFVNTGACQSAITYIDGDAGILRYRGIPIEQLVEREHPSFLETCYLLIWGDLPTQEKLDEFRYEVRRHTLVKEDVKRFYDGFPK